MAGGSRPGGTPWLAPVRWRGQRRSGGGRACLHQRVASFLTKTRTSIKQSEPHTYVVDECSSPSPRIACPLPRRQAHLISVPQPRSVKPQEEFLSLCLGHRLLHRILVPTSASQGNTAVDHAPFTTWAWSCPPAIPLTHLRERSQSLAVLFASAWFLPSIHSNSSSGVRKECRSTTWF